MSDMVQAHDGDYDNDHPDKVDVTMTTTTDHALDETNEDEQQQDDDDDNHLLHRHSNEYPFLGNVDDGNLFDMPHYRARQRRQQQQQQLRRHSYPEQLIGAGGSGLSDVNDDDVVVEDQDFCTTSTWEDDHAPTTTATATTAARAAPTAASNPHQSILTSTPTLNITSIIKKETSKFNTGKTITNKVNKTNIPLSSLPIDALQTISTYCTVTDWLSLSSTSQHWRHGIGSEVFERVRRHASLCAFEVGMAWAMGEHADARELACLYISKGVPIYPAPRGHAYHTLAWRMGLELSSSTTPTASTGDERDGGQRTGDGNTATTTAVNAAAAEGRNRNSNDFDGDVNSNEAVGEGLPPTTMDAFYASRYLDEADGNNTDGVNNRNVDEGGGGVLRRRPPNGRGRNRRRNRQSLLYSPRDRMSMTYVEEKSSFWKRKKGIEEEGSTVTSITSAAAAAPIGFGLASSFARRIPPPLLVPPLGHPQQQQRQQHPDDVAAPQAVPLVDGRVRVGASTSSLIWSNSVPDLPSLLVEEETVFGLDRHNIYLDALLEHRVVHPTPLSHLRRTAIMMHDVVVAPKMTMRVHRHLADQHFFGSPSVDDEKGAMTAGKMSMSADFFHPTWEGRKCVTVNNYDRGDSLSLDGYWDGDWDGAEWRGSADDTDGHHHQHGQEVTDGVVEIVGDENNLSAAYRDSVEYFAAWALANPNPQRRLSLPILSYGRARHPLSMTYNPSLRYGTPSSSSPASDIHLDIYSCATGNIKAETDSATSVAAIGRMRSRCQHYQQRLDGLLKNSFDSIRFQECLLDFWDEVFPVTRGIHFYNRQAAVPRMSLLHAFVTTPIPKALGTMQCEIERVKITGRDSKAATKRVKGRFFPKYEYRLFVRDIRNDNPFQPSTSPRKDSVLLVAKNKRGKNTIAASSMRESSSHRRGNGVGGIDLATPVGLASPSNGVASKRGISNYYICLPQQCDVDNHFMSSNRDNASVVLSQGESSGLDLSPLAMQKRHPIEVGRLQSNFIGTEFQIFVPDTVPSMTSEDQDTESVSAIDATRSGSISRKGGDLVRLAQRSLSISGRGISSRNSSSGNESADEPIDERSDESRHSRQKKTKKIVRRMSWGTTPNPTKWTTNRRAIANNSEHSSFGELSNSAPAVPHSANATRGELEDGAITYTANLLGNRPRMMDVCIPKLTENGKVCDEWNGQQVNSNTSNTMQMLDRFKDILTMMNSEDDTDVAGIGGTIDNHGLMLLQNRPPWWNIELGAFVLNFGGRVKVASVKNFQLCERNAQEHIMQFGRIEGRHAFTMDFQYPLSPMQAFAIAISSLQSKISFG